MARRRRVSQQELTAAARRAVDEVAAADEADAAAERVLADAADRQLRLAIVEVSFTAPDRATGALVGAALRSGDEQLARAAADLLVNITESPEALRLLEQALSGPDPAVRRRAVEALESFSDPDVLPLLAAGFEDEAQTVRRAAVSTLGLLVGIRTHPLREAILDELSDPHSTLGESICGESDVQVRRQALQGLAFADSDRVLPVVERLCRDDDTEVRQEAVLCLAAIGTQTATQMLGSMLSDESHQVASSVLDMLAARLGGASKEFLGYLKKAVRHSQPAVRRHAVLMLNRFDAEAVLPVLREATSDPDFEVARRAGEMLRRLSPSADVDWLANEMERQQAGQRALSVWEAGNIGLEATPSAVGGQEGRAERLVPMLEQALRQGSASDKVHAVNELAGLVDIAQSPAMQAALDDTDPAVRSRAADALQYTRDAGLLRRVGRTHGDPLVRRLATEALAGDPGGVSRRGRAGRDIAFTSTRTRGPELFSHFLRALGDTDEGVQQIACQAIRQYAQGNGLLPVRTTLSQVERLAEDEGASYLMQEEAARTADEVHEAQAGALIVEGVEQVLDWRGALAREAHAFQWDEEAGAFVVTGRLGADVAARWAEDWRLSEQEAAAVAGAVAGSRPLDEELGRRVLGGIARDLGAALDCVVHAAEALALVEQESALEALERWGAAVASGPALEWGPGRGVALRKRLARLRSQAGIAIGAAVRALSAEPSAEELLEAGANGDDWVALTALAQAARHGAEADDLPGRMLALCRSHAGERDHREPIGAAAVELLRAGSGEAPGLLEFALGGSQIADRMLLTQRVMLAAQQERAAGLLEGFLTEKPMDSVPQLCMALALRGAGRNLDALKPASELAGDEWSELHCARLALEAMANDAGAAEELEAMLRGGEPRERYYGAQYLALARVRSAVLLFASVADQVEAPYILRGFCAASLVRRGHPAGVGGLTALAASAAGRPKAELLEQLCRAVEDAIPLMLQCADVNVGRFA
jgi:HEAT repeat protein